MPRPPSSDNSTTLFLQRQSLSPLGAPPINDQSSGFGGHAFTESVGSCPFDFAGLIRSFHFNFPLLREIANRFLLLNKLVALQHRIAGRLTCENNHIH
jgi:hypothetical protein